MENSNILRDELSLLNENRSAVIIELRKGSKDLDQINSAISEATQTLADIRSDILNDTARQIENNSRAVLCLKKIDDYKIELQSLQAITENSRVKNAQEIKLHLGRVKEVEDRKQTLLTDIDNLKIVHDKNYTTFANILSDIQTKIRGAQVEYGELEKNLSSICADIVNAKEDEKKLTKERLKREDKVRIREKMVELREKGLDKKEEDMVAMSNDLSILYTRIKVLYYQVDPEIDVDKLITKAI